MAFPTDEGWAGHLSFPSAVSCLTCTTWAHTECDLRSKMAVSLVPKAAFLNGMQTIPSHGALPGLEGFKVTFSSRLTDVEIVLLKMKRPSILLFVYWFIHSFIFWNYNITLMTALDFCTWGTCTVAIIYTTGLAIFLNNNGTITYFAKIFVYNLHLYSWTALSTVLCGTESGKERSV